MDVDGKRERDRQTEAIEANRDRRSDSARLKTANRETKRLWLAPNHTQTTALSLNRLHARKGLKGAQLHRPPERRSQRERRRERARRKQRRSALIDLDPPICHFSISVFIVEHNPYFIVGKDWPRWSQSGELGSRFFLQTNHQHMVYTFVFSMFSVLHLTN